MTNGQPGPFIMEASVLRFLDSPPGREMFMLAIASGRDENSKFTDKHMAFLDFSLCVFDKNQSDSDALIRINTGTNRLFVQQTREGIIKSYSHKSNLLLTDVLGNFGYIFTKFHVLMIKFSSSLSAVMLHLWTLLVVNAK